MPNDMLLLVQRTDITRPSISTKQYACNTALLVPAQNSQLEKWRILSVVKHIINEPSENQLTHFKYPVCTMKGFSQTATVT